MEIQRTLVGATPVLLVEEHTLPVVRLMIAWRHGSFADPSGGAGTTRLLMDMLLRGTLEHDRVAFNALLEEMGTQVVAFAGQDAAFVRVTCLARNLRATVELVAEALAHPALEARELERLRTEAVESLRSDRDDDDSVAELFTRRALYSGHPLARSPQGEVADLSGLDGAALRRAHQRLTADQLVLAFAGDLSADAAREAAAMLLAELPPTSADMPALVEPPDPAGLTVVVVDKPERMQAQLRVARPALAGGHEDAVGMWLGVTAFGGTFTAPFCREVRDIRGWSYTASAGWDRRARFRAPLVLRSAPAVADAVDCLALELDMYRTLARGELAPDDVEFARTYLLNRDPLERASAGQLLPVMVKNELLGRAPEALFRGPEALEALPGDAVGPIMERHLDPDRVVAVLVATAADVAGSLAERLADATVRVVDYREGL